MKSKRTELIVILVLLFISVFSIFYTSQNKSESLNLVSPFEGVFTHKVSEDGNTDITSSGLKNVMDKSRDERLNKGQFEKALDNFKYDLSSIYKYYLSNEKQIHFEEMSFVTSFIGKNKEKNIFLIDNSRRRIMKLDKNNKVVFSFNSEGVLKLLKDSKEEAIKALKLDNKCLVDAHKVVVSSAHDCFFVLYSIKNNNKIVNEVIVKYPINSINGKVFFIYKDYGIVELEQEKIKNLYVNNNSLNILEFEAENNRIISFKSGEIPNENVMIINDKSIHNIKAESIDNSITMEVLIPKEEKLNEISAAIDGHVYFTTMDGDIYSAEWDGNIKQAKVILENEIKDISNSDIFPWYIDCKDKDQIYYTDMLNQCIYRASNIKNTVKNDKISSVDGVLDTRIIKFNNMSLCEDNTIICSAVSNIENLPEENGLKPNMDGVEGTKSIILILDQNNSSHYLISGALCSNKEVVARWINIIKPFSLISFLFFLLRFIYIYFMKRIIPLLFKQLINTPFIILALLIVSQLVSQGVLKTFDKDEDQKLLLLSNVFSKYLSEKAEIKNITGPSDFDKSSELVEELKNMLASENLNKMQNKNGEENILQADEKGDYYVALYKVDEKDDKIYYFLDTEKMRNYLNPLECSFESKAKYLNVFEKGYQLNDITKDSEGIWRVGLTQLKDSYGEVFGICEVGINMKTYQKYIDEINRKNYLIIFIGILITLAITIIITILILRSLRILNSKVYEVAKGNYDLEIPVMGTDEVAQLGQNIKNMALQIKDKIKDIEKLQNMYYHFFPKQYPEYLNKKILDIRLGDQVQKENMTILITSIRSFAELSGEMSPKECFKFVNEVIEYISPAIRIEKKGFVDQYYGYGMLALFPYGPKDAIEAALKIRELLASYNEILTSRGEDPIDLGIAVHTGVVRMGMIGDEECMEGAVISDNVSLATSIEKLSESLGAYILVSKSTMDLIGEHELYNRYLGKFKMKEKSVPIELVDLFEGDPKENIGLKQNTKDEFEWGIRYYHSKNFYEARKCFVNTIKHNNGDKIAKIYFFKADDYCSEDTSDDWNSALNINELL